MWKLILSTILFLSVSCFASHENKLTDQMISQLLDDREELEEASKAEDTMIVNIEEIEDIIEDLNRSESSKRRVKIWFVNNTNPLPGNGSFKNPFNTLLAAQEASRKGDIIFVFPGDNTTRGMDSGFVMKKGQRLLGAGVHHKIDFPQKKLIVRAPSTTLPRITDPSRSIIILADSCEVSGINVVDVLNGDAILGGDPNPFGPLTKGIKNTLIRKNVISTFTQNANFVLNGAIYLPSCTGRLIVERNYILDVSGVPSLSAVLETGNSGSGIVVFNENNPVSSEIIIKKNIVSNTAATGIILSHSAPKGKVRAVIEGNIVFNIGDIGDAIFVGIEQTSEGVNADGRLCVKIKNNFCQNVHDGFDIHLQSAGVGRVKAQVIGNIMARSATIEDEVGQTFLPGFFASSLDSSFLCLKLVKNFSEFGYELVQVDASRFKLEPPHKNLGLPFTVVGNVKTVHADRCSCGSESDSSSGHGPLQLDVDIAKKFF
jgi:hypothetical protein